jgi:hypothetical protein
MTLPRIVTFMSYPPLLESPKALLAQGSQTITQGDKRRYFAIRMVCYDTAMTPLYTRSETWEHRFESLAKLKQHFPHHIAWDSPVLDLDHSLKTYDNG